MAEIWAYVAAEASAAAATRLVENIEAACRPMLHFPQAGPARNWLAPGLRVAFEARYAIYYRYDDSELTVVRVLHGARDAAALAAGGGFA